MSTAASLIVRSGRVFGTPGADAVAIAGERIVAVGTLREVELLCDSAPRVIDVPGGLICPGFHDAHAHLVHAGVARLELDLKGEDSAGIVAVIERATRTTPPGHWIVGNGVGANAWPARELLDRIVSHPVLLRTHDHHAVFVNSTALALVGWGSGVPAALAGMANLERARLIEQAAWAVEHVAVEQTSGERERVTAAVIADFHRAGVVAVHDMSGSRYQDVLRSLDGRGELGLDVFATVSPEDVTNPARTAPGDLLRVTGMKAFLDGALGSRTAALLAPYDDEPGHCGVVTLPVDEARSAVRDAADAGLPAYLHAIGDAAVRTALDVVEGVPLRHRVEHAQMVHDDDLPRFAAQGVVASVQPIHMVEDAALVHQRWGARSGRAFPLRRLLDSGATLAFGSDAPIETLDVLDGIRAAVHRTGRDGTPLHPEEALTVSEAIDAYTSGAAFAAGVETELGSVTQGRIASLTVLSHDIAANARDLDAATVAATIVRGEVAHLGSNVVSDETLPAHRHHPRELGDHLYVYAVLSRRAGGVSVGVNLSPHKGCNFDCTYCQVDRTTPGRVKTVDLDILRGELQRTFALAATGELFDEPPYASAPPALRVLADVALSGDGEPTAEPWFADAARIVAEERSAAGLSELPYRIITNATTFHRPAVAGTLAHLDVHGLDVWAKLDAGTDAYYQFVDRTRVPFQRVLDNLLLCARARPTTIQTLFASHHGEPPEAAELDAWAGRLADLRDGGGDIPWVQIHTVSRPPAESFVSPLTMQELEAVAERARGVLPAARIEVYRGSA